MTHRTYPRGFTLIELLTVIAILGVLGTIVMSVAGEARYHAAKAESASNIRQLVIANQAYAADHGTYAPWGNLRNNVRWHSAREGGAFDRSGGYLSPYLGEDKRVRRCPVLEGFISADTGDAFDAGAGGYGYNSIYLGSDPSLIGWRPPAGASREDAVSWREQGRPAGHVTDKSNVVMFTSSAIARGGGIVETDEAVPYRSLTPEGLGGVMTPTVHFRFRGKALVAWADGHVTFEAPNPDVSASHNVYGDDNASHALGWFGPTEWNGFWNPRARYEEPY